MSIIIKSPREIELIREAGDIVRGTFKVLKENTLPGKSTYELDRIAEKYIRSKGGIPSSKGYEGFPGAICISVNDTLVHGIPSKKIILKDGDIVSYDVVVTYKGYYADACRTYPVGEIAPHVAKLVETTKNCFFEAVKLVKPGVHLGDISNKIETVAKAEGYTLTDMFTGHGVGREMHEDPYIFNVGKKGTGPILMKGMVLAIEPMVNEGKVDLVVEKDGWTTKTKDGKMCSHYENTVVVTDTGYELLTFKEGDE